MGEPQPFEPCEVLLPSGRRLLVRTVQSGDADGLEALYADLDETDRYRRFFSLFRPEREFFERMVTVADRGGFELVAVAADGDDDDGRIVGEAGYTLLGNGDGDLAITVAAGWRGWLGAYLLDTLLAAAAARGVPNLEADILVSNARMMALVASRGYATVDHPDWTIVRVLLGTADRTPSWPGTPDRPRVLVEATGGRWHAEDQAREAGMEVVVCPGPRGRRPRCPALAGGTCPLADGADVIVTVTSPSGDRGRRLLDAHRSLHVRAPVCAEVRSGDVDLPPGVPVLPAGPDDAVAFLAHLTTTPQPELG
jgi:hypothetical protein